ncbi:hypothetical protein BE15_25725 [Sorangium cellulosum]|uniref:Uncharacterized protein n=2 Tax=Sorangium cellulosum TaxID=56 RepID=A0A150QPN6_SORCE|nr:hypothetical protein BE15_25725 [Sorangium cellulosum]
MVMATAAGVIGCKPDRSEELLHECEAMQAAGEIDKAWNACAAAVRLSPASKVAEAASAKLQELGPAHAKLEKERAEKREQAAKAEQEAQAARLAALRKKVRPQSWGDEPDGECQAKGLPEYRKTYEGGLYVENEAVALADGCRHLFQQRSEPSPNDNIFCCPGR